MVDRNSILMGFDILGENIVRRWLLGLYISLEEVQLWEGTILVLRTGRAQVSQAGLPLVSPEPAESAEGLELLGHEVICWPDAAEFDAYYAEPLVLPPAPVWQQQSPKRFDRRSTGGPRSKKKL